MKKQFCHTFWSDKEIKFTDDYLIVWLLSILSLRKQNGYVDLISDKNTINTLKNLGYLNLYDKCDDVMATKSLQEHNINYKVFPAFSKFSVLENYDNPCIVDNDLILWKNISSMLEDDKALFTHYEVLSKPNIWYPKKEDLGIREGYTFPEEWKFNLNAVNTSIIHLGNEDLKNYVVKEAWDYMMENNKESIGKAEFIFVEQTLIPMCCKLYGIKIKTVIDSYWNSQKGYFQLWDKTNKNKKAWNNYYMFDNNSPVTHTWIAKRYINVNEKYKYYMCCRGLELIAKMDYEVYKMCSQIEEFQKYISMLERYGSSKQLVKKQIVTNKLFK